MPSLSDKHPNPAVDNFITALADKHSPFNKHVPVNFKQVADKAKTVVSGVWSFIELLVASWYAGIDLQYSTSTLFV